MIGPEYVSSASRPIEPITDIIYKVASRYFSILYLRGWLGWEANNEVATYSAFCRNFGDHYTPTVRAHNWNEEAMEKMVISLEGCWANLLSALDANRTNLETLLDDLGDWSLEFLGEPCHGKSRRLPAN